MTSAEATPAPWHALDVAEVAATTGTDLENGLDPDEAAARLAAVGPNVIRSHAGRRKLALLFDQFRSALVVLLLIAVAISGAVLNEWVEAVVILAIVVLNAALGYWQESRAEDALARLKELAAPEATVIRRGRERRIASADLVPGDLLSLAAGDQIPADARVVELAHLDVDESSLTGESLPVPKQVERVEASLPIGDRRSLVFAGTAVTAGRGTAVVVATGRGTEVGQLAALLEEADDPTPLQVELDRIGKRIAVLAGIVAVVIFTIGLLREQPAEAMFLTAVALAVAAIPEGLPAVVTVTLSRGVADMAAENAVVRRLSAVEALGASSVICTDKTGTLTRNRIRVQEAVFADLRVEVGDLDREDGRIRRYEQVAALCNDASLSGEDATGDPTEVALLRAVAGGPPRIDALRAAHPRIDEAAFDSRRKRMGTLHEAEAGFLLCVKGAPEVVLERCRSAELESGTEELTAARSQRALEAAAEMASRGLRTLALAYRELAERPESALDAEDELVLVALIGMSDEPRPEALPAVRETRDAGIRVVMVTGDHEVTARAIGTELEILQPGQSTMGGIELSNTDADDLADRIEGIDVFARVDPADKVKIIRAWQSREGIVAMTGDGVNDAPALRAADIGVAMGSGTDVAKDAADMVLADDNYATILSAVRAGRGIFANLKKVVYFLLSANISEVLVMLFGFLLVADLGPPLLATQLLWVNLVTDGLPAISLGVDATPEGLMDRPPDEQRDILGPPHQVRLFWQGLVLAGAALAALAFGYYVADHDIQQVQTITFTALVTAQMVHVYNARAQGRSFLQAVATAHPILHVTVAISVLLQIAVVYTGIGNTLFDTVPLDAGDWLVVGVVSVAAAVVIDGVKRAMLRRNPAAAAARD